MDLDEDLERGMEKSDREKEEGAAPEIKVKDQAQPVPIELPPRRKVGDAVIAHYGEATIIAIHPNGNVDVKMDSGDVLLNVLSYCVWTEAENSEGLASFDTFKKATRRGKPREEGKRKQDHTDLNKKQRIVLEGKMNTFFEGENESRLRRYWPAESLLSAVYFRVLEEKVSGQTVWVPSCTCCNLLFWATKASNIYKHFQTAAHLIAQQEQSGLSAAANAPSGVRRTTQLADAQHIARIKSAYHGLKHPTVSINAGGDNLQFAQSIFANLEGVL